MRCATCDEPVLACGCPADGGSRFASETFLDTDVSAADLALIATVEAFVRSGAVELQVRPGQLRAALSSLEWHATLARNFGTPEEHARIAAIRVEVRSSERRAA